jgi:hypothetical protein
MWTAPEYGCDICGLRTLPSLKICKLLIVDQNLDQITYQNLGFILVPPS